MNDRPGRSTFEQWTRISSSEYQGLGYTLRNEKNEFPKFIEYSLVDKTLMAKISGDGQEVLFSFEKL